LSFGTFDDHMPFHRKWMSLSHEAYSIGMRALLWARSPGAAARPGYVTLGELRYFAGRLGDKAFVDAVTALVDAGKGAHEHGILVPTEDGGYQFHDLEKYGGKLGRWEPTGDAPPEQPTAKKSQRPGLSMSELGKLGGRKSVEARRSAFGSAQPVPKLSRSGPEAEARSETEADPKRNAEADASKQTGSSFQVSSGSPDPDSKPAAAASEILIRSAPEADASEQAAAAGSNDICERARAVLESPAAAAWMRPDQWPELQAFAQAVHEHAGKPPPRLGLYADDAALRVLVGLFAAGWRPQALEPLAARLGAWLAEPTPNGNPRTLAMLKPEVMRIAEEQNTQDEHVAQQARDLVKATVRALPLAPAVGARS
jgi:hypothetical protein